MNATVNIICYRQKRLKNGEHPLMIRITKNGKRKYRSLGISVHHDHWDFEKDRPNSKCPNRELILKTILEREADFHKEILELTSMQKEYTASSLMAAKTNQINAKTVGEFYLELIKQFEKAGKVGNSKTFKASMSTIKKFTGSLKLDFPFSDMDVDWMNRYEKWLKR